MVNPQAVPCESFVQAGPQKSHPSRDRNRAELSSIVAAAFDVAASEMRSPTRGRAKVALARQAALYLAHVVLGLTLSDAGRLYGRDRTTAAHACRLIEDRRDEPGFDALLALLEDMVRARFLHCAVRTAEGGAL